MNHLRAGLPLIICLVAAPAHGQEVRYFKEDRYLVHELSGTVPAASPRLRVESDLGSVRVTGTDGHDVRYRIRVRAASTDPAEARRMIDTVAFSAIRDGDLLLFSGRALAPEISGRLSVEYDLTVPRGSRSLEVRTGAGDVTVRSLDGGVIIVSNAGAVFADDLDGPLEAETRGGDIAVGRVAGGVRLMTEGGSVRIDSAGGDLVARTSGGDVRIGDVGGTVKAETGGGSVRIATASGSVTAGTTGGNIDLGRILGWISAASAGGSIRVASARAGIDCETAAGVIQLGEVLGPVHAVTSSGNIQVHILGHKAFGDSSLQSLLGDVLVSLPDSLPVTIRAMVDNPPGRGIESEFPLAISRELQATGRQVSFGEGEVGGGGSILKLRALGGNIVIRKARKVR